MACRIEVQGGPLRLERPEEAVLSSLTLTDHHLLIRPTKVLQKREMERVA
jgi:hypothetical protein